MAFGMTEAESVVIGSLMVEGGSVWLAGGTDEFSSGAVSRSGWR
jgi:hypothetical protein